MLSVIIPVYNEEAMVDKTASVIRSVLSKAGIGCELVFVDDGSKDTTWEKVTALAAPGSGIRGVHFSRNFGKEAAILAGLAAARVTAARSWTAISSTRRKRLSRCTACGSRDLRLSRA